MVVLVTAPPASVKLVMPSLLGWVAGLRLSTKAMSPEGVTELLVTLAVTATLAP